MTLEYYRIFLSLLKQTHPQICCCSATRTRKVTYNSTRISSTCYAILWNIRLGEFQSLKLSLFNHTCVWVNSRRGKTVCRYRRAKITRGENNPVFSTQRGQFNVCIMTNFRSLKIFKEAVLSTYYPSDLLKNSKYSCKI